MYQVNFNILNVKNSPSVAADVAANRPTSAAIGAIYISTDTKVLERWNGTTWDAIGGGITGTGTVNKIPVWTGTSALGSSDLIYTVPGAYPNKQIVSGCSFESQYSDPTNNGEAAGYIIRRSSNNNIVATLFGKDTTANATQPIFHTYAQDDYYIKVFGSANYYHTFFKNGNVTHNGTVDAGYKLQVIGSTKMYSAVIGQSSTAAQSLKVTASTAAGLDVFSVSNEADTVKYFGIDSGTGASYFATTWNIGNYLTATAQEINIPTDKPSAAQSTLTIRAGNANFSNRAGGNLILSAGLAAGTGDSTNGYIQFLLSQFVAAAGVTNSSYEVARFSIGGNLLMGTTTDISTSIATFNSTTKGIRVPVMNGTQRAAIANTAGLIVFDTTAAKLYINTGAGWQQIQSI